MDFKRSTRPAARSAVGAPSCPADIAAALVGAPSRAILLVCRTIFTATQRLLRLIWPGPSLRGQIAESARAKQFAEKRSKPFPQGLKPLPSQESIVGAKAPTP